MTKDEEEEEEEIIFSFSLLPPSSLLTCGLSTIATSSPPSNSGSVLAKNREVAT
jgi:hypothetical protein